MPDILALQDALASYGLNLALLADTAEADQSAFSASVGKLGASIGKALLGEVEGLTDNAFVESFNGRMRDELFNETQFTSLAQARDNIASWVDNYSNGRPHSSLDYATPAAVAAALKKQGAASLLIAGGYATQPLASPAHVGEDSTDTVIATG